MLYHIMLKLGLVVWLNIIVMMKEVEDLKSSFIKYISNVSVRIEDVMIKQPFFILKKGLNLCILDWSFKIIMCMTRQILNDKLMCVTIFDLENNII